MNLKISRFSSTCKSVGVATFAVIATFGLGATQCIAADWSDTSIGFRYGTEFREPFNPQNISKNILDLQHVSGYKYGTNFFNVDMLMSDKKDPQVAGGSGAQEVYVVYRNTLELSKVTGTSYKNDFLRDFGGTVGFDFNSKNDGGYGSKKRMLVLGPTVMFEVPGFLNVGLFALRESNAPVGHPSRYTYKTHAMLSSSWGIGLGSLPLSFEGFMLVIAPKGKDEFGGATKTEINFDAELMLDLGKVMDGPKGTFKVGLEYQYWKNKFGNDSSGPAGKGAFAKTPMIRAEYHF